jgi:enamidase
MTPLFSLRDGWPVTFGRAAFAVLALALGLVACQPVGSEAPPEPSLVVEGGRVIVGDGRVLEEASVATAGDSILSVTTDSVEADGARRIDASGKTVFPGLIDAHVHLTIPRGGRDSTALARHLEENVPEILRGFLEHGVTTVRSTGEYWPAGRKLKGQIASRKLEGPRLITSGPLLTAEGGHPASTVCTGAFSEAPTQENPDPFCRSRLAREVTRSKEAREAAEKLAKEGADFIKVVSDSVNAPVQIKDQVVKAIVGEAHEEGLRAVGHVFNASHAGTYAKMGMDGFVHPPWGGLVYPKPVSEETMQDFGQRLAGQNAPVTTTLSAGLLFQSGGTNAKQIRSTLEGKSSAAKLIKAVAREIAVFEEAGVPIVVGTDWWSGEPTDHPAVQPGMVTITEMKMLRRWGSMSEESILQAATSNAAQALGMSDEVGTVEAGKRADLIVVKSNPLEDLSALEDPEMVVKGGDVVAGSPKEKTGSTR